VTWEPSSSACQPVSGAEQIVGADEDIASLGSVLTLAVRQDDGNGKLAALPDACRRSRSVSNIRPKVPPIAVLPHRVRRDNRVR
jgi:hypothetical protein